MPNDWLLNDHRADLARDRLLEIAGAAIRQNGIDRFSIEELARTAHCSRATVYRHVGGKKAVVNAVITASSRQITLTVGERTAHLSGRQRTVAAIESALHEIRGDKVIRQLLTSRRFFGAADAALAAPTITAVAIELLGLEERNVAGAQWLIRGVLALALWPLPAADEATAVRALVDGVVAPAG